MNIFQLNESTLGELAESKEQSFATKTPCPFCNEPLVITWQGNDIPYFGKVMHTSANCPCGFRYADTLNLSEKEPSSYTFKVLEPKDLDTRVVRSTSGTIEMPELGLLIEPGPASESYISNIEGVLERFCKVLSITQKDPESKERTEQILEYIQDVRDGKAQLTMCIKDPLGNSAIISSRAHKHLLSPHEAEALKCGLIVLEVK